MDFPSRSSLKQRSNDITKNDYNYLVEQARNINLEEITFDPNADLPVDKRPIKTKIEKQKVYFWIRVYLSEEMTTIEPGDNITIKYVSGETMDTTFICYAKVGGEVEHNGEIIMNYNSEDNKKVLCLMVDEERINYNSDDIPFLRKLFRIGRYYEYELIRRTELELTNTRTNQKLDYYDIEF